MFNTFLSPAAANFAFGQSQSFSTSNLTLAQNLMSAAAHQANGRSFTATFQNNTWNFTWN